MFPIVTEIDKLVAQIPVKNLDGTYGLLLSHHLKFDSH